MLADIGVMFSVVWCFMIALSLLGLVFMIWAVVDCAKNETDENNNRLIWILIILLLGWIGALVYYFVRVQKRY